MDWRRPTASTPLPEGNMICGGSQIVADFSHSAPHLHPPIVASTGSAVWPSQQWFYGSALITYDLTNDAHDHPFTISFPLYNGATESDPFNFSTPSHY